MATTPQRTYDVRALFKAIGRFGAVRALDVSPTERPMADVEVEMLDVAPVEVTGAPLLVEGFVDGVQATL